MQDLTRRDALALVRCVTQNMSVTGMTLQNVIRNRLAKLVRLDAKPDLPVGGLVIVIVVEMIRLDDLQRERVRVRVTADEANQDRSVSSHRAECQPLHVNPRCASVHAAIVLAAPLGKRGLDLFVGLLVEVPREVARLHLQPDPGRAENVVFDRLEISPRVIVVALEFSRARPQRLQVAFDLGVAA